jgi:hypothetical protein
MGLAELGLRSLDELIGRADLLKQRSNLKLAKTQGLDLSFIMSYAGVTGPSSVRSKQEVRPGVLLSTLVLHTPHSPMTVPCTPARCPADPWSNWSFSGSTASSLGARQIM